jgi:C1A family cysteine protease
MATVMPMGMGWLHDLPDIRDYDIGTAEVRDTHKALGQPSVKTMLTKIGVSEPLKAPAGPIDLRAWCSPIENQLNLGSCTANAGVGVLEYFERRASGTWVDASKLFLYKVTRNLLGWVGDTGAYLRSTMGALALFGAPPERYWPYVVANFEVEPTAFVYALAQNYQAISYYRLDPTGTTPAVLLDRIKTYLAAGLPSMFGFTVYDSISQGNATGKIPFPVATDKVAGGHAIVAVGYDDTMKIQNARPGSAATTGALLIRNSWGTGWGMQGYGWLPYQYVLSGLAVDWWSLLKGEWVETGQFGIEPH